MENKEMKMNEASSKIVDLTMSGASKEELEVAIRESKEMIDELKSKKHSGRYPWG